MAVKNPPEDAPSEREKWNAEQDLKDRELSLRERNASWSSPLVLAILLVAFAILAHAAIFYCARPQNQAQTQEFRSATDRILAAVAAANANPAARDLANCPPANANPELSLQWINVRCQYRFPPKDGFDGPSETKTLPPGTLVDRYGPPSGRFLAPTDATYEARALPYDQTKMDYYRYEVVTALDVEAGKIVPWFDQSGGGVQYKTKKPVRQLLIEGALKEVQHVPP